MSIVYMDGKDVNTRIPCINIGLDLREERGKRKSSEERSRNKWASDLRDLFLFYSVRENHRLQLLREKVLLEEESA